MTYLKISAEFNRLTTGESLLNIVKKGESIEKVLMKGLEVSLLASADGTEIIHHKLMKNARWGITPQENWNALEYLNRPIRKVSRAI